MKIVKGSILDVTTHGIICHQVNCMGRMGAGIALAIRKQWPIVYIDYMNAYKNDQLFLGNVIFSEIVKGKLYVASLCGQYDYGRHDLYTDYNAVKRCLLKVSEYKTAGFVINIPKGMGCSLAGGSWKIMSEIIDATVPDAIVFDYS